MKTVRKPCFYWLPRLCATPAHPLYLSRSRPVLLAVYPTVELFTGCDPGSTGTSARSSSTACRKLTPSDFMTQSITVPPVWQAPDSPVGWRLSGKNWG